MKDVLRRISKVSLLWLILVIPPSDLEGADLSMLDKGRNVRLVVIYQGALCDARVEVPSSSAVTLRLSNTTIECGVTGDLIRVRAEDTVDLRENRRLTQGRVAAKILLGLAGVGTLAAVALSSSDPESRLALGNYAVPGLIMIGAWRVVPRRLDYVVVLNCSHRLNCLSKISAH